MIPFDRSTGHAHGAASGNPVTVSGIKSTDTLLTIVRTKAGETPAGVPISTFVVSDGAIQSASVSTSGYYLEVQWTHA